jgi:hypothetical protein
MTAQSLSFVVVGYFYPLLEIGIFASIKSTRLSHRLLRISRSAGANLSRVQARHSLQ